MMIKKIIVLGILGLQAVIYNPSQAQTSNKELCKKTFSDLNLQLEFPCDGKQMSKTDTSLHLRFYLQSEFNIPNPNEEGVDFTYRKAGSTSVANFLLYSKNESKKRIEFVKKDLEISHEYGFSNGVFKPELTYKNNQLSYTYYAYLETEKYDNRFLSFNQITLIYDHSVVVGVYEIYIIKKLGGSEVDRLKDNPNGHYGRIYRNTLPKNIELIKREPYELSSPTLGLSFELPFHYLSAFENRATKEITIDYSLMDETIRSQYKLQPPITLKWVKKMTPNDKFRTVVNTCLKEELSDYNFTKGSNNEKYPQLKNIYVRKESTEPYRYIFELNGNIYDLQTSPYDWDIADKILNSVKGIDIQEVSPYEEIGFIMNQWLNENFKSNKLSSPTGVKTSTGGASYKTNLVFQKLKTEILETQNAKGEERIDWVGKSAVFSSKETAQTDFKDLADFINSIKDEKFELRIIKQTDNEILWKPFTAVASLGTKFMNMEIRLKMNVKNKSLNGKTTSVFENQLSIGSPLQP